MSLIPDQELQEIRSRADIAQVVGEKVSLKRAGRNLKGLCPFHTEKSPSFMVNPEKQIYHCFGCGAGGDVFSFLMKYEGLEFVQAVGQLAERYGVTLSKTHGEDEGRIQRARTEKELLLRINRLAGKFFYETLMREESGAKGRDYLKKREICDEMVPESFLGYAPGDGKKLTSLFIEKKVPMDLAVRLGLIRQGAAGDYYDFFRDRLIFSIVSPDGKEGKFLGFSGRALEDTIQPKYLNSPESPVYHKGDSLLGLQTARPAIRERDQVILVEGNFDMLRLHQAGLHHVVAPLGTALTELQVRSLARLTSHFILLFDGDEAGTRAAERALEIFLPMGINPRVVLLPTGEDPDSFVKKQGVSLLQDLISKAPPLLDVRIETILFKEGRDPQGQVRAIQAIGGLLNLLPNEVEKMLYIQMVAEKFGLSEGLFSAGFQQKRRESRKPSNFSGNLGDDKKKLPPMERTVLAILLSGQAAPDILFKEIEMKDFSHPCLSEAWGILRENYEQGGRLDIAKILTDLSEGEVRKLISELAFTGSQWNSIDQNAEGSEGTKAAFDCIRQLRTIRMRVRLKDLSHEIRRAETEHDTEKMKDLLDKKNKLIKEMTSLH